MDSNTVKRRVELQQKANFVDKQSQRLEAYKSNNKKLFATIDDLFPEEVGGADSAAAKVKSHPTATELFEAVAAVVEGQSHENSTSSISLEAVLKRKIDEDQMKFFAPDVQKLRQYLADNRSFKTTKGMKVNHFLSESVPHMQQLHALQSKTKSKFEQAMDLPSLGVMLKMDTMNQDFNLAAQPNRDRFQAANAMKKEKIHLECLSSSEDPESEVRAFRQLPSSLLQQEPYLQFLFDKKTEEAAEVRVMQDKNTEAANTAIQREKIVKHKHWSSLLTSTNSSNNNTENENESKIKASNISLAPDKQGEEVHNSKENRSQKQPPIFISAASHSMPSSPVFTAAGPYDTFSSSRNGSGKCRGLQTVVANTSSSSVHSSANSFRLSSLTEPLYVPCHHLLGPKLGVRKLMMENLLARQNCQEDHLFMLTEKQQQIEELQEHLSSLNNISFSSTQQQNNDNFDNESHNINKQQQHLVGSVATSSSSSSSSSEGDQQHESQALLSADQVKAQMKILVDQQKQIEDLHKQIIESTSTPLMEAKARKHAKSVQIQQAAKTCLLQSMRHHSEASAEARNRQLLRLQRGNAVLWNKNRYEVVRKPVVAIEDNVVVSISKKSAKQTTQTRPSSSASHFTKPISSSRPTSSK